MDCPDCAVLREALLFAEKFCPCGARPESLKTHPHVPGCVVEKALSSSAGQSFLDELRAAREVAGAAKEYLDYVRRGEGGFGLLTVTEVTRHQSGRYSAQREALMDALARYEKVVQR